jgi:hypothetical protein
MLRVRVTQKDAGLKLALFARTALMQGRQNQA